MESRHGAAGPIGAAPGARATGKGRAARRRPGATRVGPPAVPRACRRNANGSLDHGEAPTHPAGPGLVRDRPVRLRPKHRVQTLAPGAGGGDVHAGSRHHHGHPTGSPRGTTDVPLRHRRATDRTSARNPLALRGRLGPLPTLSRPRRRGDGRARAAPGARLVYGIAATGLGMTAGTESGGAKIPSVTGRWLSTPMSADPAAGVSLLSGVGAGPPPDGV